MNELLLLFDVAESARDSKNSVILVDNVGILTLENSNNSQVLWKDFGYLDTQDNPVSDPLVSLDGITYVNKIDILFAENEIKQIYVKFSDLMWSKDLVLNKKIRG